MGVTTLKVVNNDFVFENNRLTQLTGLDALAQIVGNRLKLWLGEWFANLEAGIDYFGLFNQKKNAPIEKRARIVFRNAILADPRVDKILTMEIDFNNANRELTINFTAQADEEKISVSVTVP
jgi:hypothetical protein